MIAGPVMIMSIMIELIMITTVFWLLNDALASWSVDKLCELCQSCNWVVAQTLHILVFFAANDNNNDNNNICNNNIIHNDNKYDANDADDSVVVVRWIIMIIIIGFLHKLCTFLFFCCQW